MVETSQKQTTYIFNQEKVAILNLNTKFDCQISLICFNSGIATLKNGYKID